MFTVNTYVVCVSLQLNFQSFERLLFLCAMLTAKNVRQQHCYLNVANFTTIMFGLNERESPNEQKYCANLF